MAETRLGIRHQEVAPPLACYGSNHKKLPSTQVCVACDSLFHPHCPPTKPWTRLNRRCQGAQCSVQKFSLLSSDVAPQSSRGHSMHNARVLCTIIRTHIAGVESDGLIKVAQHHSHDSSWSAGAGPSGCAALATGNRKRRQSVIGIQDCLEPKCRPRYAIFKSKHP